MNWTACADLVRRGDPDRFAALMAAPLAAREKLFPLFAFNLEVARAPWATQEPMIAEMRLQWWRDALEEIRAGGPVRRHEVTTPLAELLGPDDAARLDGLVVARRWDIYSDPFEDQDHFDSYIDATSGHLIWTAARLLGATTGEDAVRDAAFGMGIAAWLRAIAQLQVRGRVPLLDGRPQAVADLAQRALMRLQSARGRVPAQAIPALRTGWRAAAILQAARDDPARVADGRLDRSDFARRGSLVWKGLTGGW